MFYETVAFGISWATLESFSVYSNLYKPRIVIGGSGRREVKRNVIFPVVNTSDSLQAIKVSWAKCGIALIGDHCQAKFR